MRRHRLGRDGAAGLQQLPLFADLSIGQCRMLSECVDRFEAEPGEVLMAEGEQGLDMMILQEGAAEVSQQGRAIGVMAPGDFFGELAVLGDGSPRTATVRATTATTGLLFTSHDLRQIHDRLPDVGARIDAIAQERLERDARERGAPAAPGA